MRSQFVNDVSGDPPLWLALEDSNYDVGHILVKHGVDTDAWGPGPDGCEQTLLHKARNDCCGTRIYIIMDSTLRRKRIQKSVIETY